ncbi:hypothetical protein [Pelagicoccus mobilis]|uniref:Uncharacterized protein n=1 Tax=Pelagicoccus mobilis TaxID=415221 RepID=A0A934RYS3_9BACT|nr:hypothetical protein [Pelagicoccus mobilis]MBK1877336.1 hypothetical protein [Pelagicoccus mobilis]
MHPEDLGKISVVLFVQKQSCCILKPWEVVGIDDESSCGLIDPLHRAIVLVWTPL